MQFDMVQFLWSFLFIENSSLLLSLKNFPSTAAFYRLLFSPFNLYIDLDIRRDYNVNFEINSILNYLLKALYDVIKPSIIVFKIRINLSNRQRFFWSRQKSPKTHWQQDSGLERNELLEHVKPIKTTISHWSKRSQRTLSSKHCQVLRSNDWP